MHYSTYFVVFLFLLLQCLSRVIPHGVDHGFYVKPSIMENQSTYISIIKLKTIRDSCIIFNGTSIFMSQCFDANMIYDRIEIKALNSSRKIVYSAENTLSANDTSLLIVCFEAPGKCHLLFIDDEQKRFRQKVEVPIFEHQLDSAALVFTDLLPLAQTSTRAFALDLIYFYTSKESKGFQSYFGRKRAFFDQNLNLAELTLISQKDEFTTHPVENVLAFNFEGFAYFLRVVANREANSWVLVTALDRICLHYRPAWNESFAAIHAPLLLLKPEMTELGTPKLLSSRNPVAASFDSETNVLRVFVGDYNEEGKLVYSMYVYDMPKVHKEINSYRIKVSSIKFKYFINCYNNASNNGSMELPLQRRFAHEYTTADGVDMCSMSNCRLASQLEYKVIEHDHIYSDIPMNSVRDRTFYGEMNQVINVDHETMLIYTKKNYLLIIGKSNSLQPTFHSTLIREIGSPSNYRSVYNNNTVIITDGTQIEYIPLDCSMQVTCSETIRLRSLGNRFANCGWCYGGPTKRSFGSVVEVCSLINQSTFLTDNCPPKIDCFDNDHVNAENSTWITLNGYFPKSDDQRIDVCGSPCSVMSSTELELHCRAQIPIESGFNAESWHCPIMLETSFLNETYRTEPTCARKLFFAKPFPINDNHHRLLFVAIIVLIIIIASIYALYRNLSFNKKSSHADWEILSQESSSYPFDCCRRYSNASEWGDGFRKTTKIINDNLCYLVPISIRIPWDVIVKKNLIGMGNFGEVYKGDYTKEDGSVVTVAIKTLRIGAGNVQQFIDEGVRMKNFDHKNVLSLVGLTFDEFNQPLIITPFMAHGDLLSYLRCSENHLTVGCLLEFGLQIAEGLEYLHHLRFVHRDLAARNCMLDEELCIKVADFGLSRDVYETEYYKSTDPEADIPVKWLPIESIECREYSSRSDVVRSSLQIDSLQFEKWSFGIVLWELMTRGLTPYPHMRGYRILEYIKSGRRLPKPDKCHEDIYELMKMCWQEKPADRPDSTCVMVRLKAVMTMLAINAPSYSNMKITVESSLKSQKYSPSIETLDIKDCD